MDNRTTIQISENLRKELRILASMRDVSYQELLEEMVSVFKELDSSKTIISIPTKLGEVIQKNIKGSDFKSLSEYVTFLLRLMLIEEGVSHDDKNLKKIRKRLRGLGYL